MGPPACRDLEDPPEKMAKKVPQEGWEDQAQWEHLDPTERTVFPDKEAIPAPMLKMASQERLGLTVPQALQDHKENLVPVERLASRADLGLRAEPAPLATVVGGANQGPQVPKVVREEMAPLEKMVPQDPQEIVDSKACQEMEDPKVSQEGRDPKDRLVPQENQENLEFLERQEYQADRGHQVTSGHQANEDLLDLRVNQELRAQKDQSEAVEIQEPADPLVHREKEEGQAAREAQE